MRDTLLTFRTKRQTVCVAATAGERILFAGLRNGFDLPYECVSGACGTCQAVPLNASPGVIEDAFPKAPARLKLVQTPERILMCQSLAHGSVELRVFSQVQRMPVDKIRPDYLRAVVELVREIARDTVEFTLETERPLSYQAGQFVTIASEAVRGNRAYSMHTASDGSRYLNFVVKLAPNGSFSRWIAGDDRVGNSVTLFGPLGRAVLESQDSKNIFAIAGGTGIAGIIPIFEQLRSSGQTNYTGTLIFAVRTFADAFFLDRLDALCKGSDRRIEAIVALSHDPSVPPNSPFSSLKFQPGFAVQIAERVLINHPHKSELSIFLAGPPPMIDAGISMLHQQFNVDAQRIKFDRFQ